MGAEFSPKIAIVDESPIRAAILEEELRVRRLYRGGADRGDAECAEPDPCA